MAEQLDAWIKRHVSKYKDIDVKKVYTTKKIIWIDTSPIHVYGGGLHCILWDKFTF